MTRTYMSISEISRMLYLSVALVINMKLIEFRYQETFINYFNLKLVDFDGDWKANTFLGVLNHSLAVLCAGSGTLLYN